MDKRSEKYQEVDLDTFQFWPGETCGCISSIGTIMNKEELRIMRGLHAEHWRPISPRSKFSSLYWTPLERGEGGEREGHGASTDSVRRKPFATTLTDGLQTFQGQTHYHRPRTSKICLSQVMAFVIAALMVAWAPSVVGFNVDLKTAVVHEGPRDSMFGYAVAQHIDQSTNWVLIGAPKAQTSQAEIVRGGAVFRCKTDRARSCQEMPFDEDGNNVRYVPAINDYVPIEDKSNQWFGSTIQSSGENGVIVACAPRYVYFSDKLDKREPIGACYVARTSTTKYEKFSPCRSGGSGFNNQGYCQAGVSASLSKDGSRLLIGAPGSWYWQGQLFNYDTSDNRRIFAQTPEGQPDEDDTYMGYASAVGEFDGNSTFEEYVVGIPKGANSTGMVEIYTQNMTVIGSLRGEQIGSYFGSALAVLDVNADREDDIVVGAPFFGNVKGDEYESGRVYIYYQTKKHKFKRRKRDILNGFTSRSRFGMALSRLGDINYDGFDDLCVGAPYAGEDRQGAVYFFHGSSQGIITDPTQVIYAKDVASPLSAFGISVSGGWDQDSNDYPDLLVGAYASDKAVFFRTRPVIKMAASIAVEPSPIDLKLKKCGPLNGDPEGPCLAITICYGYSGLSLPNILNFYTTLTLDSKDNSTIVGPAEQRAFFTDKVTKVFTEKTTVNVTKDQQCNKIKAYVKGDLVDKLTPIKVVLEFKLNEEKFSASGGGDLLPILDARIPTWTLYTVEIKNDCGDDNICYPNLAISGIRTKRTHVIGTTAYLDFVIIVNNFKEDAYNTKAWITLPPGVVYDTISNQRSTVPISCGKLESDSRMVVCDIGNPMKGGTRAEFTMIVTPTNTNDTQDRLVFILFANSSNTEEKVEDYSDNHNSVEFPVTAVAEISLQAKVNPEFIVLNTTREKKVREERLVTHVFQLRNQGTCAINETILQVLWPSNDEKGNDLLYLTGPPLVQGNGKCNITVINPQNAKLFKDRWWIHDSRDRNRNGGLKSKKGRTSGKRIDCSETGDFCTVIQCHIGYMKRNSVFEITMESGFRPLRFLRDRISTDMYKITSVASARVLSVPYDFKAVDTSKFVTVTENAVTVVHTDKLKPAGKGVKIWVIALAITAGVLLLILLILLLWFCGFFRRKKHEEARYLMVKNGQSSYIDSKIVD